MFCTRCGATLEANQRFCPSCGVPAGVAPAAAPLVPPASRVAGHIRVLGILWLVLSVFRLLPGMFLISVLGRHFGEFMPPDVPLFVPMLMRTIGSLILLGGLLGIIAGWGLLARQPWGRMLAIVLGFLNLIELPFGTALGIYTLWVLLPERSGQEYRQLAQRPA